MAKLTGHLDDLIEKSSTLDQLEKKYWRELIPSISEKEAQAFQTILEDEKRKLQKLERDYKNAIHAVE